MEKYIHSSLCRQNVDWDYFTSTSTYRTNNMAAMPTYLILNLNGVIKAIGRLLCMYKSLVLLGLYGKSANVFRDCYTFRTLLYNAISKENKKQKSNSADFSRLYCEMQ